MSDDSEQKPEQTNAAPVKEIPAGSSQHVTAGPYSPVLRIKASELIVISGQVAVAPDGSLTSENFAQQSEDTLKNCLKQLASAGCSLADVFKVNVYLADLADWGAFNAVYTKLMPDPKPVRTAIGCGLLPGYLVEVEMWAAR
jgi:2-iminobutanoate/2-iminopropanoate deaminase